jgi:hypothetical protein
MIPVCAHPPQSHPSLPASNACSMTWSPSLPQLPTHVLAHLLLLPVRYVTRVTTIFRRYWPLWPAYAAACSSVGFTVPSSEFTLTLPSDWDGPVGLHLNTVYTAVVVGITGILGVAALLLLSNMWSARLTSASNKSFNISIYVLPPTRRNDFIF